jgi:hypothetical protein
VAAPPAAARARAGNCGLPRFFASLRELGLD